MEQLLINLQESLQKSIEEIKNVVSCVNEVYSSTHTKYTKEFSQVLEMISAGKNELEKIEKEKSLILLDIEKEKKKFLDWQKDQESNFSRVIAQEDARLKKDEADFLLKKKDYTEKEADYLRRTQQLLVDEEEIRVLRGKTEKIYNDFSSKNDACRKLSDELDVREMNVTNLEKAAKEKHEDAVKEKEDNAKVAADIALENARLIELNKVLVDKENELNHKGAILIAKEIGLNDKEALLNSQEVSMEKERQEIRQARSDLHQKENNLKALEREINERNGRNEK